MTVSSYAGFCRVFHSQRSVLAVLPHPVQQRFYRDHAAAGGDGENLLPVRTFFAAC